MMMMCERACACLRVMMLCMCAYVCLRAIPVLIMMTFSLAVKLTYAMIQRSPAPSPTTFESSVSQSQSMSCLSHSQPELIHTMSYRTPAPSLTNFENLWFCTHRWQSEILMNPGSSRKDVHCTGSSFCRGWSCWGDHESPCWKCFSRSVFQSFFLNYDDECST